MLQIASNRHFIILEARGKRKRQFLLTTYLRERYHKAADTPWGYIAYGGIYLEKDRNTKMSEVRNYLSDG